MIITERNKLVQPCEDVGSIAEAMEISDALFKALELEPTGVGLAAPQIGIYKRVFVAHFANDRLVFANPKITSRSTPFIHKNEGCLSFPKQKVDTIRYKSVKVVDLFGEREFSNFISVIVQHEYEHLHERTMFESSIPEAYDECFCGSIKKFKFCCMKKLK
jgi:peptide deformylase